MKFTLSWLKAHLETEAPLKRISAVLSAIGLEVEAIEDRAAALAPFRIARVIEAKQHPNADRLSVCSVDTGAGIVSVVCGAPNAYSGMKAVFAAPGSVIPGTGKVLKAGMIRGLASEGMLLSARELGVGEDHEGIVELPQEAPVGAPYALWSGLDDPVIEIAVTPNRGDALAVRGVARDLAAAGLGVLKPWSAEPVPARFPSPLKWEIEAAEACPWVLGRSFRGLSNGPSPPFLARRLRAIGLRPINALVDITNFFTIDLGRPLHGFDAAKLSGRVLTMRPGRGETFRGLNGRDITATPEDCVIADERAAQSLAGIVGGEATGCDETTTSAFLECALFDPLRIAISGRRLQVSSDARARFERGIDAALMVPAVEAASRMILDLCGGEASEIVAAGAPPVREREASLRFARLLGLGGADIDPDEAVAILRRLGFVVRARDSDKVTVAVPSWRNDIAAAGVFDFASHLDPGQRSAIAAGTREVEAEADLVEEVLRIRGLDTIPPHSLPRPAAVPQAVLTEAQKRLALARRALAVQGLAECLTFSFMPRSVALCFGSAPETLRLANPIAAELDQLRPSPLATLVLAAARNGARGQTDFGLFEIGPGFADDAPEGQVLFAAGLRCGSTPRHWATKLREIDGFDAKTDLYAVLAALGVPSEALFVTADAPAHYHPGRSGTLWERPKLLLGWFGELDPVLVASLELPAPAAGFELRLDAITTERRHRRAAPDLVSFQPLKRDFAFVVERTVPADAVLRAARSADRRLIAAVTLFDRYSGPGIPPGRVSLGVEVVLQPRERSLTDPEIEEVSRRIVAAVAKATGAVLR